jgi:hypothetical protein
MVDLERNSNPGPENPVWEYWTGFLHANIDNTGARECLKENFPESTNFAKHSPLTMIPRMNEMGKEGWELVHMEPVSLSGAEGEVSFWRGVFNFSHDYFCVFKRRATQK